MTALVKALFKKISCPHDWQIIKEESTFKSNLSLIVGFRHDYILACRKCGRIKKMHL